MDPSVKWLLLEGMVPLIGTAVLYWALLLCFTIAESTSFTFKWGEAVDSLGWLYGAAVLAIQAAVKGWDSKATGLIPTGCSAIAIACFLMLITAMFSKAADATWKPGKRMKIGATLITVVVLGAGFQTHRLMCCAVGGVQ
jgi:hypothetical protein